MPTSGRDAYAVSSHAAGTFVWPPVYTALATTNDIRPTTCVYIRMAMDIRGVHQRHAVACIHLVVEVRDDSESCEPAADLHGRFQLAHHVNDLDVDNSPPRLAPALPHRSHTEHLKEAHRWTRQLPNIKRLLRALPTLNRRGCWCSLSRVCWMMRATGPAATVAAGRPVLEVKAARRRRQHQIRRRHRHLPRPHGDGSARRCCQCYDASAQATRCHALIRTNPLSLK